MDSVDVVIVLPGLIEAPTNRGGGIEEQHYALGIELSKNLKVVQISPFYRRFNGSVQVNNCFEIAELYFPATRDYPYLAAIECYVSPFSSIFYSFLASVRIIKLVGRGAKAVIITDPQTGFIPLITAKVLGVKVIFSEGNLWPWVNPYLTAKRLSLGQRIQYSVKILTGLILGNQCDLVRVQSDLIKKAMIKRGINEDKIAVIESGVDIDLFRPTFKIPFSGDNLKVGFIGRLTDEKGVPLLLKICKEAEKEVDNVRFIIMGGGPYEEDFKTLKNVEHVGQVPRDTIPLLLAQIHVVLFFQTDLGVAEVEAMACGKAILTRNSGEIPKIIKHMENGLLCDLNPESYIDYIKLLLTDRKLLIKISDNARKTAMSNFTWDIIGKKWFLLVNKTIQDR